MDLLQIIDCYVASGSCSLRWWEMFIADTMVIIMDMFWPFDVKPKQEIEDCETLAKAFHLAFSYIESCCKVMSRHVKHDHIGDPATF